MMSTNNVNLIQLERKIKFKLDQLRQLNFNEEHFTQLGNVFPHNQFSIKLTTRVQVFIYMYTH